MRFCRLLSSITERTLDIATIMNARTSGKVAITVGELRRALKLELAALRELLVVVEKESLVVNTNEDTPISDSRFRSIGGTNSLFRALLRMGGDDLRKARIKLAQTERKIRDITDKVERHDRDVEGLSLVRGLLFRNRINQRADRLETARRRAILDYKESYSNIESIIASLVNPNRINEAMTISREIQQRYREKRNTKRYLEIRRQLLLDDIALYEETNRFLEHLDQHKVIEVSDNRLDRLFRDKEFGMTLLAMTKP